MLLAIVLIFSLVPATSFAASATSAEKTDDGTIEITSKAKTASYKITWNANGGKIGTKKTIATSVKKGSKLAKVAKSPKRGGYTFKGWYTKKSGGTKISKNTKPKKSVTYFAQWNKKGSTSANSKLVGDWQRDVPDVLGNMKWKYYHFLFNKDGTFHYFLVSSSEYSYKGKYSVSNGKIYFSNVVFRNGDYKTNEPNSWVEYVIAPTSKGNEQLKLQNSGESFTGSTWWYKYK